MEAKVFGSKRGRIIAAMVLVAGAAGLAANTISVGALPSVVRLHLGSDGRYFQVDTTKQTLTTANSSCGINSAEPVIDLSATGAQASPGLGPDSIGVKSRSGANGTPCGQVDSAESLQLKPGTTLAGKTFSSLRLDLEMTGNAIVKLTLARSGTNANAIYQLQTGTSITPAQSGESDYDTTAPYFVRSVPGDTTDACAAPNSSGPNSAGNDNCQWTVQPGFNFDTITLTTVSGGSVSLEGGGDFPAGQDFDSLFYLSSAPVAVNDTAEVDQNGSVTIPVLANDTDADGDALTPGNFTNVSPAGSTVVANADGTVTFTPPTTPAPGYTGAASFDYQASDGNLTSNVATVTVTVFPVICTNQTVTDADAAVIGSFTRLDDAFACKRYALEASAADGTVLFQPTGAAAIDFRGVVSLAPQPAPAPGGPGTVTLLLRYDPNGGSTYQPVQWCINPQFDGADRVTSATIPTGETWCIASADTRGDINGDVATTWQVFGHDDPRFR
jgi:hypothetical protein